MTNSSDSARDSIASCPRFGLSLFNLSLSLSSLVDSNSNIDFSYGFEPTIDFKNFRFLLPFSICSKSYSFKGVLPQDDYSFRANIFNIGFNVDYLNHFNTSVKIIGSYFYDNVPLNNPKYLIEINQKFYLINFEKSSCLYRNGTDFQINFSYFSTNNILIKSYYSYTTDLGGIDASRRYDKWRFVSQSTFKVNANFLDNASFYSRSLSSLSSMLITSTGTWGEKRLNTLARQRIAVISPYFFNKLLAFYSYCFAEGGYGFLGDTNTSDCSSIIYQCSLGAEAGIRVRGLFNIFARFLFYVPKNYGTRSNFGIVLNIV